MLHLEKGSVVVTQTVSLRTVCRPEVGSIRRLSSTPLHCGDQKFRTNRQNECQKGLGPKDR